MRSYIIKPKSVKKSEIIKNDYIFSASRHNNIQINSNFDYLVNLIKISKKSVSLTNQKKYFNYVEIGSINTTTGYIEPTLKKSIDISTDSVFQLEKDDILISTVRTYLGGIGIINQKDQYLVASKALIVLRELKKDINKYYLFGILRTGFFIEQTNLILNASMYPRMDKDSFDKLKIPFPTNTNHQNPEKVENHISNIVQNIIDKEEQIKLKNKQIDELIEKELKEKQKAGSFSYRYPKISEIREETRLDTGLYERNFKEIDFLIRNYEGGIFQIPLDKFKSGSTPKVRVFDPQNKKYKWVTPTLITDQGNYQPSATINMDSKNNLSKDCILIINRTSKGKKGEYVGITCFYEVNSFGLGQHNQGLYQIKDYSKFEKLFIICLLNSKLYRKLCGCISIGSKMKEMKSLDFAFLKFPNFPDSKQKEIVNLYYKSLEKNKNLNIENYLEIEKIRNRKLGIFQLNLEIFSLQEQLETLVHKIVSEEYIEIDFAY
ncbi:MAG: hypothetical protein A2015_12880 [Spirochaetes bacterium GWF1_31_7]|nr:MAG: hypothetical protein A2Y30_10670 [Spirochaetes bacterium GWE1_32_154]OHD49275.1 MAG: hypothetical protein A2Y29_16300 [Spirochaetes bacterium GWE2_31_10]OHD51837.1 MAG: hypothetical protein A2015_12880 [Spirochaetes bacterium GWF1_31_7]HBD95743.1 hypothetical protein [Spirochaetia bacterium]HBI37153.1 hypothetical protein [Spirochaetia bacterium]